MPAIQKFDYLSKDFLTVREELFKRIPILTKNKWTDLNESDPGITILELISSMFDNLMFYLDMQGQELYLPTARQRDSVIRLLKLIGYTIYGYRAASGQIEVSVRPNQYPTYPITIPKGTQCTGGAIDGTQLIFTTMEEGTLFSSNTPRILNVRQGVTITDYFVSTGSPEQKFILSSDKCDRETVEVIVNNNEIWAQESTFYYSTATSKHFKTDIDENSKVYIEFGDGQFGEIPGKAITVNYIQTNGASGNVGKQAITNLNTSAPLDAKNKPVQLLISNSTATSGGDDPETIEHAKEAATALLFAMYRALSRGDFTAIMKSVPGVEKAIAWGEAEEENPDYNLMNRVRVCFFSKTFSDMYFNIATRSRYRHIRDNVIKPLLLKRMPITTKLTFIDPVLIDVFVSLRIGIDVDLYDPTIVVDAIRYALLTEYALDNVQFGQDIRISQILKVANSVEGVSWAQVTRLSEYPPQTPDLAPNPPVDLIIEKWKLPNLIDYSYNLSSITTKVPVKPYLILNPLPSFQAVGTYDVVVTNPDSQFDIITQSYTLIPSANLPHIEITYSSIIDEPAPTGGYYGNPNPEADCPTSFSSIG